MARLSWGDPLDRRFEAGVDRGVLYPPVGRGVPWNGLVSVDQRTTASTMQRYYLDGKLYHRTVSSEEFSGKIQAYTYPEELDFLTGYGVSVEGIMYDQQEPESFGLSYRTMVGDSVNSTDLGYKIHIVYNALATPASQSYKTLNNNPTPETFSWDFETKPSHVNGFKPTSHLIFDTTIVYPGIIEMLEDILYGSYGIDPRLPTLSEVVALKNNFDLVKINENTVTGLNPLTVSTTPDLVGDLDKGLFVRSRPTRLRDLPTDGLSDLEN